MGVQREASVHGSLDRLINGRSTLRRINGTVAAVSSIFAFIYWTVVFCVVCLSPCLVLGWCCCPSTSSTNPAPSVVFLHLGVVIFVCFFYL